ncbi:ComF family protein [Sphingomonas parva]|uniref:ComF family protein n=2 Tax=Sphingomonas parva TaxID=2555898 RepID=A0A4Y8ZN60_9SPHN|nr:ComF family protein [Sphingomonas parva]
MWAEKAQAGVLFTARALLDFALPPRCPACGTIVSDPHRFCLGCWSKLVFLAEPCCARCGLPFAYPAGAGAECGRCLAEPPPFDRLRAAVAYDEVARKVALKLKYSGRPGVAETLAGLMARHLRSPDGQPPGLLVPVPLHRWRIWRRGYNQAALIAASLSRRSGIPAAPGLLRRTRHTPPLRGLGRRERAEAVRGAFAVENAGAVAGRRIILVDDVFTSGATGGACAKVLKRAGAASVEMLCWARVVREMTGTGNGPEAP